MQHNKALFELIQWHLREHGDVEIQDIYKLLYQGIFGAEHLLKDAERAKKYLEQEWVRVPAEHSEVLLEPASTDGRIVRANLRRCKAEGLSIKELWTIFYRSVDQVHANIKEFEQTWQHFEELCRATKLPFDANHVRKFGSQARSENWPAKHHTDAYRRANYPAYRIVLKNEFEKLWQGFDTSILK